jgi:hypothetical protein
VRGNVHDRHKSVPHQEHVRFPKRSDSPHPCSRVATRSKRPAIVKTQPQPLKNRIFVPSSHYSLHSNANSGGDQPDECPDFRPNFRLLTASDLHQSPDDDTKCHIVVRSCSRCQPRHKLCNPAQAPNAPPNRPIHSMHKPKLGARAGGVQVCCTWQYNACHSTVSNTPVTVASGATRAP